MKILGDRRQRDHDQEKIERVERPAEKAGHDGERRIRGAAMGPSRIGEFSFVGIVHIDDDAAAWPDVDMCLFRIGP